MLPLFLPIISAPSRLPGYHLAALRQDGESASSRLDAGRKVSESASQRKLAVPACPVACGAGPAENVIQHMLAYVHITSNPAGSNNFYLTWNLRHTSG